MSPQNNQLVEKLGLAEDPVQTSVNVDNGGSGEKDYLKMLELALLMPVLSLVKMYLTQSNGTKKTIENCMLEFRSKHPNVFLCIFLMDLVFRTTYLMILISVAVRGLGLDTYIKNFCVR